MRLHTMIKFAASRKVLGKMLNVMEKNPGRYGQTVESIQDHRTSLDSGEKRVSNTEASRKFDIHEPQVRKDIRNTIKRNKRTQGTMALIKAYDISDADQNPDTISKPMPHMMVDVFNKDTMKRRLDAEGVNSFDEVIKDTLENVPTMPGKKPHIDFTPDYERVAKPSYLKSNRIGTLFQKGWGRSELVNRANETKARLQGGYKKTTPERRVKLKNDLGEIETALKRTNLPKPKGLEIGLSQDNRALPTAEHELAFRGTTFTPSYGEQAMMPKIDSTKNPSTWISPHPEVARSYADANKFGLRQDTSPYYLNTSNPKLIAEFSKPKYKPKGYT